MTPPKPAQDPPALLGARALVRALIAHGMHDVVLAPGSRSAPLAYALAEAVDDGALRLHVRIDERSAGFLALGIARGQDGGQPGPAGLVGVVTTSGTAVANLHPAVLEAHHGHVPLIVLSADRPHELRGTGANQTTDQVGIFGTATRYAVDVPAPSGLAHEVQQLRALAARAAEAAAGLRSGFPGPVHLNVSFRDPLAPLLTEATETGAQVTGSDAAGSEIGAALAPLRIVAPEAPGVEFAVPAGRTVLVAGDCAGAAARELAEVHGWPLLAESVSGAAGGPNLVWAHAQVLTHARITADVEHVVVVGRPTLSRPVQRLLARPDVEVIVIAPGAAPWPDAASNAAVVLPAIPRNWLAESGTRANAGAQGDWLRAWRSAGELAHDVVVGEFEGLTGPYLAHAIAQRLTAADTLVVGSSNPVRDLDLVAAWAEPPRVVANRGLAGIDGLVSTATGVALAAHAARRGGVVRAYLGDLTFLHDVGGLLRAPGEPEPDLQIIVANDGGGSIFAGLEHGALGAASPVRGRTFERIFSTPHTADLAALCAGYGVTHLRADDVASLTSALTAPPRGVSVLEVPLDRARRRESAERLRLQLTEALDER